MEICRIGSRDDDGYDKFLGALQGYLKDIEADKERMKEEHRQDHLRGWYDHKSSPFHQRTLRWKDGIAERVSE